MVNVLLLLVLMSLLTNYMAAPAVNFYGWWYNRGAELSDDRKLNNVAE